MREFFTRHALPLKVTAIDSYGAWLQKTEGRPVDTAWYLHLNRTHSTADAAGAA